MKSKNQKQEIQRFKEKYFDYYDDIKHPSHRITDW